MLKRFFDFFLGLLLFLPALLICLVAAIPVWLECRVSPLFIQQRVGRNGRLFLMLKMRTMRPETASAASHEVSAQSILRCGYVLRRFKIDELPQIWNILRGDMSFVGPRPCLPTQTDLIRERMALGVYNIRPGITGRAQISGIDMSQPAKLARTDADYMAERSFVRDIKYLVETLAGGGKGDAVPNLNDSVD